MFFFLVINQFLWFDSIHEFKNSTKLNVFFFSIHGSRVAFIQINILHILNFVLKSGWNSMILRIHDYVFHEQSTNIMIHGFSYCNTYLQNNYIKFDC